MISNPNKVDIWKDNHKNSTLRIAPGMGAGMWDLGNCSPLVADQGILTDVCNTLHMAEHCSIVIS